MYVKYKDFTGSINTGDVLLMSAAEFAGGGKNVKNIPVTITPDGSEPVENPEEEMMGAEYL